MSEEEATEVLDESTLERIERSHQKGLTSQEILEAFADGPSPLSEATLRKYVQLGLLPRSVRVGEKGKHRGSRGLYPVRVLRQILLIRQMMSQDFTIEQIQKEFLFLKGELDELEDSLGGIFAKLNEASAKRRGNVSALSRDVKEAENVGRDLVGRLRTIEGRLRAPSALHKVAG